VVSATVNLDSVSALKVTLVKVASVLPALMIARVTVPVNTSKNWATNPLTVTITLVLLAMTSGSVQRPLLFPIGTIISPWLASVIHVGLGRIALVVCALRVMISWLTWVPRRMLPLMTNGRLSTL